MNKIISLIAIAMVASSVAAKESSDEARRNTQKMIPAYLALSDAEALVAKSVAGQRMTRQADRVFIGNYQVPATQICFMGEGYVYGGTFKKCVLWRSSTSNELIKRKAHDQDVCVEEAPFDLVGPATTTHKRCIAWEAKDGSGTVDHDNGNGCKKWANVSYTIGHSFNVAFFRTPKAGKIDHAERYSDNYFLGSRTYSVPSCK
jgi:hypothetical protein